MVEGRPITRRTLMVRDLPTTYIDLGAGEVLVALQGIPTSSALFEPLLPYLEGYRVLAPDLLGQGATAAPPQGPLGYRAYAAHLAAFLEAVPPPQFHLLVHDLGGVLGLDWACRHPGRVQNLTILSTTTAWTWRWAVLCRLLQAANLLLGARLLRWAMPRTLRRGPPLAPGLLAAWAAPWTRRRVLRGTDHFARPRLAQLAAALPRQRTPALILWGERDPIFPLRYGQRIRHQLPQAVLRTIPHCGHWAPLDAPDEVAAQLLAFLQDQRGRTGEVVPAGEPERTRAGS